MDILLKTCPSTEIARISLLLWVVSLALPAIYPYSDSNNDPIYGYFIFLFGWIMAGEGMFPWFANIFLLFGNFKLILSKSTTLISSFFALLCLLELIRFCYYPTFQYPLQNMQKDFNFGIGAYLWMLSIVIFSFASFIRSNNLEKLKHNKSFKPTPKSGAV